MREHIFNSMYYRKRKSSSWSRSKPKRKYGKYKRLGGNRWKKTRRLGKFKPKTSRDFQTDRRPGRMTISGFGTYNSGISPLSVLATKRGMYSGNVVHPNSSDFRSSGPAKGYGIYFGSDVGPNLSSPLYEGKTVGPEVNTAPIYSGSRVGPLNLADVKVSGPEVVREYVDTMGVVHPGVKSTGSKWALPDVSVPKWASNAAAIAAGLSLRKGLSSIISNMGPVSDAGQRLSSLLDRAMHGPGDPVSLMAQYRAVDRARALHGFGAMHAGDHPFMYQEPVVNNQYAVAIGGQNYNMKNIIRNVVLTLGAAKAAQLFIHLLPNMNLQHDGLTNYFENYMY